MIDIAAIASNLTLHESGLWVSCQSSVVSYPALGNQLSYDLEERSFWFKHRNNCIITILRAFPPQGTMFDVGGGNGFVAASLQQAGFAVALVEPGWHGARNAQTRGVNPVICSTLADAGFQSASLPAIGLFDVLEHIPDDTDFLHSVQRVLTAQGKLYLTVPAYQFLWSVEDDYAQHYRRYTLSALSVQLRSAGFIVDFATYIFALLPLPIFLFRTLPTKWKRRTAVHLATEHAEHAEPSSALGRFFRKMLTVELTRINNKQRIPCGGSCLVVAHVA